MSRNATTSRGISREGGPCTVQLRHAPLIPRTGENSRVFSSLSCGEVMSSLKAQKQHQWAPISGVCSLWHEPCEPSALNVLPEAQLTAWRGRCTSRKSLSMKQALLFPCGEPPHGSGTSGAPGWNPQAVGFPASAEHVTSTQLPAAVPSIICDAQRAGWYVPQRSIHVILLLNGWRD